MAKVVQPCNKGVNTVTSDEGSIVLIQFKIATDNVRIYYLVAGFDVVVIVDTRR